MLYADCRLHTHLLTNTRPDPNVIVCGPTPIQPQIPDFLLNFGGPAGCVVDTTASPLDVPRPDIFPCPGCTQPVGPMWPLTI